MKNILKNTAFISLVILLILCCTSCFLLPGDRYRPSPAYTESSEKATVINYTVDGCTWLLILEDGTKLQPVNLSPEFQKNNLKVWITYSLKKGASSICMTGKMVTLASIQLRK
ncbi:MAG: hypothetical protein JWP12_2605 [Bacteroidetes bacterium]|nr:hypothetical protein [Bacteroidota bacterium]